MLSFQVFQDLICSFNKCGRHTCHLCYVDTKTVSAAAPGQLAKKNDLVALLLYW